jgi:hypothetical protein
VVGIAIIGLLWVATGLTIAEFIVRVRPRSPARDAYVSPDPVRHHRLKPSHTAVRLGASFRTNALGLKDREYLPVKAADAFRVLVLGDSFVEGFGLSNEDTMPKQAEGLLAQRPCQRRVEVVNGGVASYSPILEYLFLRDVGLALEPDLVVLAFDMTDVHDDKVRGELASFDADRLPRAVPADRRAEAAVLLPPIAKPSALRFLDTVERLANRLQLYQSFRASRAGHALFGPVALTPEQLEARGLVGHVQYDPVAITRDLERPGEREAWAATERYVAGIARLVQKRGTPLAVLLYPHAQQVSASESPVGRRKVGAGPGLYRADRPFRRMEAIASRLGLPVIDVVELFRERSARDGPLFFVEDMHHNPRGARVFAEGVVRGLLAARLVPCR